MDVQYVFVDEAEPDEPLSGADAAGQAEVAAGLLLESGDGGDQVLVAVLNAQRRDWAVQIIATPATLTFINTDTLETLTGSPARSAYRLPGQPRSPEPTP